MILSNSSSPVSRSDFRQTFVERTLAGDGDRMLYVVPNRVARNTVENRVREVSRGKAFGVLNVSTLDELAGKLFATAAPHVRLLSDAESAMLIEESIRTLLEAAALTYFERPRGTQEIEGLDAFPVPRGTFELIVNTVRRLEQSGVSVSDLKSDVAKLHAGSATTTEYRRAKDLALIYEAYTERLGNRLIDAQQRMTQLIELYNTGRSLAEDLARLNPTLEEIVIEGFDVLDPPELAFLALLLRLEAVRPIVVTRSGSNADLFAAVHKLEADLQAAGYTEVADDADRTVSAFANVLSQHLFEEGGCDERPAFDGVELRKAVDPVAEVRSIARSIKRLYHEDSRVPVDLSRIVVATPNAELYTPLIREIFSQFGIPVFIADRYHLDRAPILQAVFALIEAARFGPRSGILSRLLRSPYFTFTRADGERIEPVTLLGVIARHHLSGSFEQVLRSLRSIIVGLQTEPVEGERQQRDTERELAECREAIAGIESIAELVSDLRREMTPSEFRATLVRLLTSLGVHQAILRDSASSLSAAVLEVQGRALASLMTLLEQMESLLLLRQDSARGLPLGFYHERLRAASIWARYNPRPNARAVQVLSLEQSVDQPADYLFLAGLQEDALPRAYQPQVFLPETRQTGESKQLAEDRLSFFRAITNFGKRLYLSYSERSTSGRALGPSEFVRELQSILDLECRPVDREETAVYSYADLYRAYGERSEQQRRNLVRGARSASPFGFYRPVLEEHIPHTREVEQARANFEDTIYRGYLDPSTLTTDERQTLEHNSERVWSVSQLELYARCGFKYFLQSVLKLEGVEEEEDGLEASAKGTLLHEILRRFMLDRRAAEISVRDAPIEESVAVLERIAREHIEESPVDHPFWQLDVDSLLQTAPSDQGILYRFVKREHELLESELRPQFFEVGFGLGPDAESDPMLILEDEVTVDGLRLRGKIDRIDVGPKHFAIVDYKSGNTVSKLKDINRGTSLQLPLYLRVAEDVLRSHYPFLVGVAGIYHKLSDPKSKRELGLAVKEFAKERYPDVAAQKTGLVESVENLHSLIDQVVARAKEYVEGMCRGEFRLTDADLTGTVCTHCEYKSVCRVREAEGFGVLREAILLETESSPQSDVEQS